MLTDPLAAVEVKFPGVIAMLVAPVAVQFSVLLAPALMLAGFASNELIAGAGPVPVFELFAVFPQPVKPRQARATPTSKR